MNDSVPDPEASGLPPYGPTAEASGLPPYGHGDASPWPRVLLDGFRAGRREALTEVYRRHAPALARTLRFGFSFGADGRTHRFGGYAGAFELQDALQETFRRAFEADARLRYDGLRPFGPYLFTIARNVVLRTFRAREVLFPTTGEMTQATAAAGVVNDAPATPEADLHRARARALVTEYLNTLSPADRQLLTLRFVEGVPQREAAETLGMGRQRLRGREDHLRDGLLAHLRARGADRDLLVLGLALFGLAPLGPFAMRRHPR